MLVRPALAIVVTQVYKRHRADQCDTTIQLVNTFCHLQDVAIQLRQVDDAI